MSKDKYQRIACLYDLLDLPFEHGRYQRIRPRVFEGLGGRILDAGVGTGRNIPFYPPGSTVIGIDQSSAMLKRAARRLADVGGDVELREADVLDTGFADDSFDAVVATFLFCVLDESLQLPALRELARICKPTGSIRILEYCYSKDPKKRRIMRLWAPWARWAHGAKFDRHTEQYLPEAGLEMLEETFVFQDIIKMIVARPMQGQD
ncbi:MAG: class I SAM-dependent methyltransferase [Alphaproteobacteria bacterium]|jgi:ubiquinone/menaquinone biosynthesis C-methylase UbiE|nr:class I SAM-dependent methyltransferase [Alphaproteobacteria bacterium]